MPDPDTIELTTMGIDIGSSTSHAAIAVLRLRRLSDGMLSRFVVTDRRVLQQSDVILTPYKADGLIETTGIRDMIESTFRAAGMQPGDVDTGAVILTGTALDRDNSQAVAHLFAEESGRFVCAAAGHNLEAILSAHGSGAVDLSRGLQASVLHVDIGGGTTKFSHIRAGRVLSTAAIQAGGRLIAFEDRRIRRLEPAAEVMLELLGVNARVGGELDGSVRQRLADLMGAFVVDCIAGSPPSDGPLRSLILTGDVDWGADTPGAITFSGGVSEFLRQTPDIPDDDLGALLMSAVMSQAAERRLPTRPAPLREGVRATVVGASQYSVQVSGSTIDIDDAALLPLHGVPVVRPTDDLGAGGIGGEAIANALRRLDLVDGGVPIALSLPFTGSPGYAALSRLADIVIAGIPHSLAAKVPTVISLEADVGLSFGTVLRERFAPARNVVILDGLDLRELDYVDLGAVLEPAGVVPVVVKSLAFPGA